MTRRCRQAALLVFIAGVRAASAGIVFTPSDNTIRVVLYPRGFPCTLARLHATDRSHGWDKVHHDPKSDTYTVDAHLVIGDNDGTDTYFQVGSREHPNETLVVNGNLAVSPYYIKGENPGLWYTAAKAVNRLTLGLPDEPTVQVTVKIVNDPSLGHIPSVGAGGFGGQLHVYNSTVTAAVQDRDHAIGRFGDKNRYVVLRGDSIVLRNATFSWMASLMAYGAAQSPYAVFECVDSTFEHGGIGLIDAGDAIIRGTTFRNLATGICDWGSLDLVLVDCVFEANRQNWNLRHSANGLIAIDCAYDDPMQGNAYRCWKNPRTGAMQYPTFTARRHIVVQVVDAGGAPVENAVVQVVCEQGNTSAAVDNAHTRTNPAGRTPGKDEEGAILLTETVLQATDTPDRPAVKTYSYTVTVRAPAYQTAALRNVRPRRSWETFTITLRKLPGRDADGARRKAMTAEPVRE